MHVGRCIGSRDFGDASGAGGALTPGWPRAKRYSVAPGSASAASIRLQRTSETVYEQSTSPFDHTIEHLTSDELAVVLGPVTLQRCGVIAAEPARLLTDGVLQRLELARLEREALRRAIGSGFAGLR